MSSKVEKLREEQRQARIRAITCAVCRYWAYTDAQEPRPLTLGDYNGRPHTVYHPACARLKSSR